MEIKYIKLISESKMPFFTRQNLEVILGAKRRTLDYRIKSLITKEILIRIKSGVFINALLIKSTSSREELMSYVGCQIVPNSYISLEYALSTYGILAESVYALTFVTTGKTRRFETSAVRLIYRNIKPSLYTGFILSPYENFSYSIATPSKALFDYLYLTTFTTANDMREFITNARINWDVLSSNDKKELKNTILVSKSQKMNTILQFLIKQKIL